MLNPIGVYCCSPFRCGTVKANAFVSRCVAFYSHYVLHILSLCSGPKIVPSVIRWVFVNMVNLMHRPFPRLANPNENMRFIGLPLKTYIDAPFFLFRSSSSQFPSRSSARSYAPSQFARFWVIIKMLANGVWVRFCHFSKLNRPCSNVNAGSFN